MAVTTLKGHVSRALDFYKKNDIYFCIGGTTPWENENNPPDPLNTDTIDEIIGYKKVEAKFLVVPDEEGTLVWKATKWKIVPMSEALSKGARWVYISTKLSYTELPVDNSYRKISANTGLVPSESVKDGRYNLLPDEVSDPGIVEVLDYRKPVYREADQVETLKIIIEF